MGRRLGGVRRVIRTNRDRLADEFFDRPQITALFAITEADRDARCAGAGRAADAMDIRFGLVSQIKINDMRDAIHIDAAGGHVTGNQQGGLTVAEVEQCPLTGVLALVAVDRLGADADVLQMLHQAIGPVLRADKNQAAGDRSVVI